MNNNTFKQALILTSEKMLLDEFKDAEKAMFNPSDNFIKKINKLSKRYDKFTFKLTYTRARKIVCIFIAILLIMLSSLSVSAVRDAVSEFFIRHFSNHDVVEYRENITVKIDYPDTIKEVYEISSIPDDYELLDFSQTDVEIITMYLSNSGQIILKQTVKDHYKEYINNEYKQTDNREVNGINYSIYQYHADNLIIWDNGKYIFSLFSSLNIEESIDLCKNIKIKK